MDVSAVGQAAAQISSAQRAQAASIAAIRSSTLQAQSLAQVLSSSAAAGAAAAQPVSAPAAGGNGGDTGGGSTASSNAGQARGSLVNILV
jgi:nucleoid-associated protein YgaU